MDNQILAHTKYNCTYHIVFIPKSEIPPKSDVWEDRKRDWRDYYPGPMSILWTKKVERLCCFFQFLILLLLRCQITDRAMNPFTVIPAFYVFKDCSAGFI